jgi:Retroviral aspartyl protease.
MSAGGNILVTQRRKQQILMICGSEYQADLFVIPMKDITVILGMDWLSHHGAQIDCGNNTVTLENLNGEKVVYQGDRIPV